MSSIVELLVQARHAKSHRGILAAEEQNEYLRFGMYAYGNQYGITGRTQSLPHTVKYLNNFLKDRVPDRWSSIVISNNNLSSNA